MTSKVFFSFNRYHLQLILGFTVSSSRLSELLLCLPPLLLATISNLLLRPTASSESLCLPPSYFLITTPTINLAFLIFFWLPSFIIYSPQPLPPPYRGLHIFWGIAKQCEENKSNKSKTTFNILILLDEKLGKT